MTPPNSGDDAIQQRAVVRFSGALGEHAIPIPVPPPQATMLDLLPAAREISEYTTALALEGERTAGRTISCRAGCGACCRQLVGISVVEAESLARIVAAMPEERATVIRDRFAAAVKHLEEDGLLSADEPPGDRVLAAKDAVDVAAGLRQVSSRYFALGIPCPFLENESCSIHPVRPMVCREYHVTSPASDCANLFRVPVVPVELPLKVGEVLARTYGKVTAETPFMIPLVLSLEWSAAHGAEINAPHEGRALLNVMVGEFGK